MNDKTFIPHCIKGSEYQLKLNRISSPFTSTLFYRRKPVYSRVSLFHISTNVIQKLFQNTTESMPDSFVEIFKEMRRLWLVLVVRSLHTFENFLIRIRIS